MANNATWVGPSSAKDYYKTMKAGNVEKAVDQMAASSAVPFTPSDSRYWQTRDGSQGIRPEEQQILKANLTVRQDSPVPMPGATLLASPITLEHSVRSLSKVKPDETKFIDTLTPGAKRVYLERSAKFENQNVVKKVAKTAGGLLKEAFAEPLVSIADTALNKVGVETKRNKLQEQEKIMETKIDELVNAGKYDQASTLYDEYMSYKIGNMSDLELQRAQTEHPVIFGVTEGLAVGSMQFIALRNAPFLKTMGDTLKAKTAAQLSKLGAAGGTAGKIASSKYGRGLVHMAEELMGDLPTEIAMPILNFDYDHRPVSELPKQALKDLSILVPSALAFHTVGYGISGAMGRIMPKRIDLDALARQYGGADNIPLGEIDRLEFNRVNQVGGGTFQNPVESIVSSAAGGVVQAAGRVLTMLKALRVPLSDSAGTQLEKAALGEADNVFTRILDALPEDKETLVNHFRTMRSMVEGENRLLMLQKNLDSPSPFNERRLAGLGGQMDDPLQNLPPLPENNKIVPTSQATGQFDQTAKIEGITPEEQTFMRRTGRTPRASARRAATQRVEVATEGMKQFRQGIKQEHRNVVKMERVLEQVEAKAEFDQMVAEVRSFREGVRQGGINTKADIRAKQLEVETFINERLPMKYRGRAISLIRRAATPKGYEKALEKLDEIVRNVELSELRLGVTRGNIKRSTRSAIKDLIEDPVPEIDIAQPPARSVWFGNLLDLMDRKTGGMFEGKFGAAPSKKAGEVASGFMRLFVDALEPARDLTGTYNRMKAYPKVTSQRIHQSWQELADIYNRNFASADEVRQYHRYAYLLQMRSRNVLGLSNPAVTKLSIPNNPTLQWLDAEISAMKNPKLERAHAAIKQWDDRYILQNLVDSGRITQAVAEEWKTKYPDHVTFMYDKYARTSSGNPFSNRTYNFTARDYLSPIKGSEGMEARANLFDTRIRSSMRSISDLYTDEIASSMREDLGMKPLKVVTTPTGGRRYQAIVKGQLFDFDADDLLSDTIEGLRGQRVLYSSVDQQAFLVPQKLYDVVHNIQPKMGTVQKMFATTTGFWRDFTTTYNPIFAIVTNPARDLQNALVLTDHATNDFLGAYLQTARDLLASALYKDPSKMKLDLDAGTMSALSGRLQTFKNWMARQIGTRDFENFHDLFTESGGAQGGYYAFQSAVKEDANTIGAFVDWATKADNEYSLSKINTKFVDNKVLRYSYRAGDALAVPFKTVRELGEFFEKLPRGAEFRLSMEKSGDPYAAAARASDISVDFHKSGSWFRLVKNAFPFSNANIQGTTNLLSAATGTRVIRTSEGIQKATKLQPNMASAALFGVRTVSSMIAPAVGLWWWRKKTGVEDRVDQATRDNYWVVPTDNTWTDEFGNERPVVITIRKGEAAQMFTPIVDDMLNYWYSQDPTAFNQSSVSDLTDRLMSSVSAFIRVPLEVKTNHSFYYRAPIEPENLQSRPQELRSFKGTTWLGKRVGEALGVSPIKGDYILRNMFPAPMTFYRAATQEVEPGKSTPLTVLEVMNVVQTPTSFFQDQELQKKQTRVMEEMKNMGRARYATTEEMVTAQKRLMQDLYEINDAIQARLRIKQQHPLEGLPLEFQNATPAERKAMWPYLSPQSKQDAVRRGYVTPKKR